MATYKGTKYSLTALQLKKITRLCDQEQGSVAGCAAEASLMANLYELVGKKKYKSLYDYVRNGGWFYRAPYYMDNGSATQKEIDAVMDVLKNGNRTEPLFVDEHDCFGDLLYIIVNGKKITDSAQIRNRSAPAVSFLLGLLTKASHASAIFNAGRDSSKSLIRACTPPNLPANAASRSALSFN